MEGGGREFRTEILLLITGRWAYERVSNISKKPPTPSKNVKVLDLAT